MVENSYENIKVPFRRSIVLKVIIAIVFSQLFILSSVGYVYVKRVTDSIDETVSNRLLSIGSLLQASHLKYAALSDRGVLTELVGEDLVDGMIVGVNGTVYHALDKKWLGKSASQIPSLQPNWFNPTELDSQLIHLDEDGMTSLISITPIFTMNSTRPFLFGYVKMDSTRFTMQKNEVKINVILSILGCIGLSSIIIYLFLRKFVFSRLSKVSDFTAEVARGDLTKKILHSNLDEIGALENGLNRMAEQLSRRKSQRDIAEEKLVEANENLEKGVSARTSELSAVVNDLQTEVESHKKTSQALTRQSASMQLLQHIILSSNETTSRQEAWNVGLSTICKHFRWPVGVAYTLDEDARDELSYSGQVYMEGGESYSSLIHALKQQHYSIGKGLVGAVLRSGRPQWITIRKDGNDFERIAYSCGMKAAFAIPILVGREVVAVLEFFSSSSGYQDSELIEVSRDIGIQLGRVVERKRAQEYLNSAKLISDQASFAKTEFVSKLGHELRTPINAIVGFGELLQFKSSDSNDTKPQQLDTIIRAGRHMAHLVDQVTDLTKIEVGELSIELGRIDLVSELEQSIQILQPLLQKKNIQLEIDGSCHADVFVTANSTALKQIILNLLTNSIHYGNVQNSIKINVECMETGNVHLNFVDYGGELTREEQAEIFKPLARLDRHRGLVDGLGIGLTLSQEMAKAMGGDLIVKSYFEIDVPPEDRQNVFSVILKSYS